MKKIVLLISFHVLTILISFGQTSSGTLMLGTSFNLNGREYQDVPLQNYARTGSYSVSLQGGKLIRDNLVAGLALTHDVTETRLDLSRNDAHYYTNYHIRNFSAGPFIRKYIPLTDRFLFFGQGTTGITFGRSRNTSIASSSNSVHIIRNFGAFAEIAAGFTYFISSKIGLDLSSSGFTYNYTKHNSSVQAHNFHLGLNLASLNYGIRFYFAR
jgi:hypothetical protein